MKLHAHTSYRNGRFAVNGSEVSVFAGEPEEALLRAWDKLNAGSPLPQRTSRISRLVMVGTEPFFLPGGLLHEVDKDTIGVVLMGRNGSALTDERYFGQILNEELASPALFVHTLPNIAMGELSIRHRLHGSGLCLMAERPEPSQLETACTMVARTDHAKWLICGWADTFADQAEAIFILLDATHEQAWKDTEIPALFNEH